MTFIKVFTVYQKYHTWIHPPPLLSFIPLLPPLYLPFPISGSVSTGYHFLHLHTCIHIFSKNAYIVSRTLRKDVMRNESKHKNRDLEKTDPWQLSFDSTPFKQWLGELFISVLT
jgi:hypothetical protein